MQGVSVCSESRASSERRLHALLAHLKPGCDSRTAHQQLQAVTTRTSVQHHHQQHGGSKVVDVVSALALVNDGDVVTVGGFAGACCPDALLESLRSRFDATASPNNLHLLFVASASDGKGRGLDRLALEGLIGSATYAWAGNCPNLGALVRGGGVQAWNLPLGVVSHMIRDVAAKRLGPVTRVGLNTFVDPRNKGGRMNAATKDSKVELVTLGGREMLWYKAPERIDVALLRGTTADADGNISLEREPVLLDSLYQAMAARNSGGRVVVQVERVVPRGGIPPRLVHVPGVLVDAVVVCPSAHLHPMTFGSPVHDASVTGHDEAGLVIGGRGFDGGGGGGGRGIGRPSQEGGSAHHHHTQPSAAAAAAALGSSSSSATAAAAAVAPAPAPAPAAPPLSPLAAAVTRPAASMSLADSSIAARRIVAHRAMLEAGPGTRVVNLGVGMPEGVAAMMASHGHHVGGHVGGLRMTVESGAFGGTPQSGPGFGTARDAEAFVMLSSMLDYYQGGGIDVAFLGMAEVDAAGNVNVSRFEGRAPGCGGFIDISSSSAKVVFVGTFTAGGLKVAVRGGRLAIEREGRQRKFRRAVQEVTFAAAAPALAGDSREVLYITERAVFGLLPPPSSDSSGRSNGSSGSGSVGGDGAVNGSGGSGAGGAAGSGGGGSPRLQLLEVAPGINVEQDVLAHMDFMPAISPHLKTMDARVFEDDGS